MLPQPKGSIHLFRAFGVNVYLHWSWFFVAAIQIQYRRIFDSAWWHLLMYVSLFGIVLLHEFGHALACRSVGGVANRIVLWPLGGVAYVQPPPRPGAVLWSIVAGPLVNVVLVPLTLLIWIVAQVYAPSMSEDAMQYFQYIVIINAGLLIFNMLPIYPLDGGQTLQALLWFVIGRSKSLAITAAVGMGAAVVVGVFALVQRDLWILILAMFVGWQAFNGFRVARYLAVEEAAERDQEARWAKVYGRWDEGP